MNVSTFGDTTTVHPVPVIPAGPPASTTQVGNETPPLERAVDCQLDHMADLLALADDYPSPPLTYELPEGFLLTVVIPVYNEQETVRQIIARVKALPVPTEIIVVDDCSTDATSAALEPLAVLPGIQVIRQAVNQGKGAALRTGFQQATGDVIIIQDADLEYDPRDIVNVIEPLVSGAADVVYGSRFLANAGQDPSRLHRLANGVLTDVSNRLTGLRLTDMETCYKAFRRNILHSIPVKQNRFGFEPEITARIARRRHRLQEVAISYHPRGWEHGKKIGFRDAVNAVYCMFRYWAAE